MADSWVGGDLGAMHDMARTMKAAPHEMEDVVHALSSTVDAVVGAAGWQGDAAEGFRKSWTANSIQAGALSAVVGRVGSVVGDLADNLEKINRALYDAAHEAGKEGVPIGSDGRPEQVTTPAHAEAAATAASTAAAAYADTYDSAMQLAKRYRLDAAETLSGIYDQISFDPGRTPNPDQWVTIGDYLRGLYTLPGERNHALKGKLPGEIEDARERMKAARRDMKAERAAYQRKGMKLPRGNESRLAHSQAVKDLKGLETDLSAAEAGRGELPLTKALDVRLGDVAKEIAGIDVVRTLPEGLEFLKDVPVVDVTASGVAAELQSRDDIDKGWSPAHARAVDYGSAGIGLAAGAGAGAVAGALSVSTGGAVLLGGAVAVGVGDFVYQGFHEHWREDIAQHGALGGVAAGVEHMGEHTGEDVKNMAVGAWHGAQHLWHSIFE